MRGFDQVILFFLIQDSEIWDFTPLKADFRLNLKHSKFILFFCTRNEREKQPGRMTFQKRFDKTLHIYSCRYIYNLFLNYKDSIEVDAQSQFCQLPYVMSTCGKNLSSNTTSVLDAERFCYIVLTYYNT